MNLHKKDESLSEAVFRWKLDYEKFITERKDIKTVENYMNVINKFESFVQAYSRYNEKSFSGIDHKMLDDYFLYRDKTFGKKLNPSTKRNDKKVLILFFEYIEDENIENFEFTIKWKKVNLGKVERKEKVLFSEDVVEKFLKYLEKRAKKESDELSYMLSFTFKLALFGGLRATEICKLKLESFGKPYVSKSSNKKFVPLTINGKNGTVFTNPITYEHIKNEFNYFKRNKTETEILFRSIKKQELNRFHLYRYFENISNELGLGKKGIHIIRRTFASNLNELGVDIRNIQLLMRHTDIKTTSIYTARSQRQMEDAAAKL